MFYLEKTSEQTLETNQPEQNFEEQSTDETDENSDNSSLDQLEPSPPEQKLESSPPEECLEPSPPEQKLESSPQEEKETSPLEHPSEQPVEPSPPVREPMTYNPAEIPITLTRQFQAGVTYVGMDGYIYVQEIKQGTQAVIALILYFLSLLLTLFCDLQQHFATSNLISQQLFVTSFATCINKFTSTLTSLCYKYCIIAFKRVF